MNDETRQRRLHRLVLIPSLQMGFGDAYLANHVWPIDAPVDRREFQILDAGIRCLLVDPRTPEGRRFHDPSQIRQWDFDGTEPQALVALQALIDEIQQAGEFGVRARPGEPAVPLARSERAQAALNLLLAIERGGHVGECHNCHGTFWSNQRMDAVFCSRRCKGAFHAAKRSAGE